MNKIQTLREERKQTMKYVAADLNLPYTTYVGYEKGEREPNAETLIRLAEYYSVPVDFLVGAGPFDKWDAINADRAAFFQAVPFLRNKKEHLLLIYGIDLDDLYAAPVLNVIRFISSCVESVEIKPDGKMSVELKQSCKYLAQERPTDGFVLPTVTEDTVTFPVIGDLAAGYENIALEDWRGDTVEIPVSYLKGRGQDDYLVLCVKGDSMYPAYCQGDRVLILRQEDVEYSGAVGAVRYDDEMATLKIVEKRTDENGVLYIRLKPINPQYPPLEIRGEALDHFSVIGVPRLLVREIEE